MDGAMLKKWSCILSCGILLLSCTDDSYRGTADQDGISSEPMPVMIVVGNPDNVVISRGSGAIDSNTDEWVDSPIYVYSFRKDLSTSFTATSASDSWNCLVDGSVDKEGSLAGKMARISALDSYANWAGPETAVYYQLSTQPYDFYAYYVDDMEIASGDIVRTSDYISMPVEIDGSQDLMSAKAELHDEQLNGGAFTEEVLTNIRNYAYSAYTAAYNIQPVVYFRHHLTRLCFDIYPGFTTEDNKQILVDAIEVRSRTKGVFTVAAKSSESMGVDFSGDETAPEDRPLLPLRGEGGQPLIPSDNPDKYLIPAFDGDISTPVYDRESMRVGESLLVAPDTQYEVRLHLRERMLESGAVHTETYRVTITAPSGNFQPGYQYNIRFAVYGLRDVRVSVTPEPWGDGGNVTVDDDNPPAG